MRQLAGVDLQSFLQDISKLPAAVGGKLGGGEKSETGSGPAQG
jgi:hypothetical protein